MEPITMVEFAKQQGVSYQAIRQQVKRYENELQGHLIKKPHKNGVFLDEWAQKYLAERRGNSQAAIVFMDRSEEYERLKQEVDDLKGRLLKAAETIAILQGDKAEAANKLADLQTKVLAIQDKARDDYMKLVQEEAKAQGYKIQLEEAKAIVEAFEPFLFGLYRKKPVKKKLEGRSGHENS